MFFSNKTFKRTISLSLATTMVAAALPWSLSIAFANQTVFSMTDFFAGESGVITGDLGHPLQRAGGPATELVDGGLLVSGRSESWHAIDLLRDFPGAPLQAGDTITFAGTVFDAPAGSELVIGGAESPWTWISNILPGGAGTAAVSGTQDFNIVIELTEDIFTGEHAPAFERIRFGTNGPGASMDFLITTLDVTRAGGTAIAPAPTTPVTLPATLHDDGPHAGHFAGPVELIGDEDATPSDLDFTVLHTINAANFADFDAFAGEQMSGEITNQGFRLQNTTGNFYSGQGNYLRLNLPEPIEPGTELRVSWDVFIPAAENPALQTPVGPGLVINSNFGQAPSQPTNATDLTGQTPVGQWYTTSVEFTVSHEVGDAAEWFIFRFRVNNNTQQPVVYYINNILIESAGAGDFVAPEWDLTLPSLSEVFAPFFTFGNIYPTAAIMNQFGTRDMFQHHFNSITAENWHKPDFIAGPQSRTDRPTPAEFDFTNADNIINWSIANDIEIVFHAFFWHGQTPLWLFASAPDTPLTRAQAIDNMHFYVSTLANHFTAQGTINYISSIDVFNEAVASGGGTWGGDLNDWNAGDWRTQMREDSMWWRAFANGYNPAIGEHPSDMIFYAFYFARQYFPNSILTYNDYNEEVPAKRNAIGQMVEQINQRWAAHPSYDGRLLIEQIGLQSHFHLPFGGWSSNLDNVRPALERFAATGARLAITELDITAGGFGGGATAFVTLPADAAQQQAAAYARLFGYYLEFAEYIDRVTIWGLADNQSWRAIGHPLLFDAQFNAKPAFHAIVDLGIAHRAALGIPFVAGAPVPTPPITTPMPIPAPVPVPSGIIVLIDGTQLIADVPAQLIGGSTMLPLRAVFEAISEDIQLDWNEAEGIITATWDDNILILQIGNNVVTFNGQEDTIPQAPVLETGRTLVPIRVIAESFGANVQWDGPTETVTITLP